MIKKSGISRSPREVTTLPPAAKKTHPLDRAGGPSATTRFPEMNSWFAVGSASATARPSRYSRRSGDDASRARYSCVESRRSGRSMAWQVYLASLRVTTLHIARVLFRFVAGLTRGNLSVTFTFVTKWFLKE